MPSEGQSPHKPSRIDVASILGIIFGPLFVLLGQWLEGGDPRSILQESAALIVLGATVGACLVSFSPGSLMAAVRDLRKVISDDAPEPFDVMERILEYTRVLKKEGAVRLEELAKSESYKTLRTGLNLIASNTPDDALALALDRAFHERVEHNNAGAEVFEAAGGYLPTFGILGAVLGLIHTMNDLNDPTKVGIGIATAFVATVYGVGIANLIAFPIAKKIRSRAKTEKQLDQIVVTGVKAMKQGMQASSIRRILTEGMGGGAAAKPSRSRSRGLSAVKNAASGAAE
jgi:chemotaxis protein MotA